MNDPFLWRLHIRHTQTHTSCSYLRNTDQNRFYSTKVSNLHYSSFNPFFPHTHTSIECNVVAYAIFPFDKCLLFDIRLHSMHWFGPFALFEVGIEAYWSRYLHFGAGECQIIRVKSTNLQSSTFFSYSSNGNRILKDDEHELYRIDLDGADNVLTRD